jgi:hypothetical protein
MNDTLSTALRYRDLRLPVIPAIAGQKRPALSWPWLMEIMQTSTEYHPTETDLRQWFGDEPMNVGVLLGMGPVFLACRDFPSEADYRAWVTTNAEGFDENAPTAQTGSGGIHVYARQFGIPRVPERMNFSDGSTLYLHSSFMVVPPSEHPLGQLYQWLVPMPEDWADIPVVDERLVAGEEI